MFDPDCADATAGVCDFCDDVGACSTDCSDIDLVDNSQCRVPACGDGILDYGESCDDGNLVNGDGCDDTCLFEGVPAGWTCEAIYYDEVADNCDCGCGVVDPDCADMTNNSCQFCDDPGSCATDCNDILPQDNSQCIGPPECGNGVMDLGETCDDGNLISGDGCSDICLDETVPPEWTCPPGYYDDQDGCDCGCGIVDPDCLDVVAGACDFCTAPGGCGFVDCSNIDPYDNGICTAGPSCGDGVVAYGEQCDDGNYVAGDGCDDLCQWEIPATWTCGDIWYGANDGCDCGCGALDPDCADATAGVCDWCDTIGSCALSCADIDPVMNWTCVP